MGTELGTGCPHRHQERCLEGQEVRVVREALGILEDHKDQEDPEIHFHLEAHWVLEALEVLVVLYQLVQAARKVLMHHGLPEAHWGQVGHQFPLNHLLQEGQAIQLHQLLQAFLVHPLALVGLANQEGPARHLCRPCQMVQGVLGVQEGLVVLLSELRWWLIADKGQGAQEWGMQSSCPRCYSWAAKRFLSSWVSAYK